MPKPDIHAGLREVLLGFTESECTKAGLDTANARVEAQLALRRMGLRVVERSTVRFRLSFACPPMRWAEGKQDIAGVLTVVSAWTEGWVTPSRTGAKASYLAKTWDLSWHGNLPPGSLAFSTTAIRGMTGLLSAFESDWLAANPKCE
jgi:hypothetical protein